MQHLAKETVVIVHGTWANPKPDHLGWYQIPDERQNKSNFVSKLNSALEKRGSPARCWAHCKDDSEIFSWSGENAWIDRTLAASNLAAYINKLQADGWRCHVVAHSHGGNVIAEALPAVIQSIDQPTGMSGTITTLGTPFIDVMSPVVRLLARKRRFKNVLQWLTYLMFVIFCLSGLYVALLLLVEAVRPSEYLFSLLLFLVIFVSALGGSRYFFHPRKRPIDWSEYWNALAIQNSFRPFILSISSPMDEAWQLLHHLRAIPNPLAPKSGLTSYLWERRKAFNRRNREISRIHGVAIFSDQSEFVKFCVVAFWMLWLIISPAWYILGQSGFIRSLGPKSPELILIIFFITLVLLFYMALFGILTLSRSFQATILAPVRWLLGQGRATTRILNDIGTYVARRRSWSLLQEIAFGLDGYSFELPKAEREPTFACPAIYKYEDLPANVEHRALSNRDEWIRRNFGAVTETFSRIAITASDLSSLLRIVETDLSLVHATYYTDEECIERIADWIADTA